MGEDQIRAAAFRIILAAVLVSGCEEENSGKEDSDGGSTEGSERAIDDTASVVGEETDVDPDTDFENDSDTGTDGVLDQAPTGWIGSPCKGDVDCDYAGGLCLKDYPRGMCTLECDRYCPDREEYPMTFCSERSDVPEVDVSFDGACVSRCDFGFYLGTGCRPGYGCILSERANDPEVRKYVCLPGAISSLSDCQRTLAELGVSFEPAIHQPESPRNHPELTCKVEDPVWLHAPIHDVDFVNTSGNVTPNILAACNMALALVETVDDVAPRDVDTIIHGGTYNCRVIAGSDKLSRHGHGDAIDIFGFEFTNGDVYSVFDHFEQDTETPMTQPGMWLYETAYRWHELGIWNIILTPNYNSAHDDHFHVDVTPEEHFIRSLFVDREFPFIGSAPFVD